MISVTEICASCNGTGIMKVLIDSLLFEDRRFCTRCVIGAEKAQLWAELLRQAAVEKATGD